MNQGAQSGGAYATVPFTDSRLITIDDDKTALQADQLEEEEDSTTQRATGLRLRGVLCFVAYTLVAVHLARAACRARHDPWDLCFVLAAAAMLSLLLYCIGRFEALVNDAGGNVDSGDGESRAARERRLRVSVWALSTLLTFMFSARVAAMLPPPAGLVLAVVALAVAVGGLCLLFLCDAVHEDEDCGSDGLKTCDGKLSENV